MRWLRFLAIRILGMLIALAAVVAASQSVMFFAPGGTDESLLKNHVQGIPSILLQSIGTVEKDMFTLNFHIPFQYFLNDFTLSLMLSVGSIVIAAMMGVPLGLVAAVKKKNWLAHIGPAGGLIAQGVPSFTMAVILQLIFAVFWPVLPLDGMTQPGWWFLPMCALALNNVGYVAKFMQTGMNEALTQDYVLSAKARGLPGWKLVLRHAMRPALMAVVTFFGPQTALIITGTVVIEDVFSIQGLGGLFGYSLSSQGMANLPGSTAGELAIASIFVLAVLVMVLNLAVDMTYRALDPRLKY